MAQENRVDDRVRTTDSTLYLPAGLTRSVELGRFERLWGKLFNHHVDPPTDR